MTSIYDSIDLARCGHLDGTTATASLASGGVLVRLVRGLARRPAWRRRTGRAPGGAVGPGDGLDRLMGELLDLQDDLAGR